MPVHVAKVCYLVGLIVYVAIRGVFGRRTKRNEKVVSRVGVCDRALVAAVLMGSFILPVLYVFTPLFRFADYQLPTFAMWCGLAVMVYALWLFWRSHVDLGLNWSITLEMRKGHELVTNGVYRRIRHPMYSAIFLFAVAQGMLLPNWLAGWARLVTFAALYATRVGNEEKMMREVFGSEYDAYMQRTGRLWPR
jgi:protein-S-isoprenylcysteine O-methyltransferase Ste14